MTNASDGFLSGGQSLNYGKTHDTTWLNRPRGGMVIDEPREIQQTDQQTRLPLWWDAAQTQPKTQLVFTVVCDGSGPAAQQGWRTDERRDPGDAGHRQVYVKGKDKIEAIKAEIARHGLAQQGRPGIRPGDYYYECWTGMRPAKIEGNEARTWAVMLFPGAGIGQTQFFGNEPQPPQTQAPTGFGAPQQAPPAPNWNAPVTGQQPPMPQTHVPAAQGNAYGFGHQPPASPGGQAFQTAQNGAQGWNPNQPAPAGAAPHPGPPPQFQAPAQQPMGVDVSMQQAQSGQYPLQGHGAQAWTPAQHKAYAVANTPQGFGAPQGQTQPNPAQFGPPVPPVDNPWGAATPAQNPYA